MSYNKKYYRSHKDLYKKGGKYYSYKGKENNGGLIVKYGRFIITFD